MKREILLIPIKKGPKYNGPFNMSFKRGNKLTDDWEVITQLLEGLKLVIYN